MPKAAAIHGAPSAEFWGLWITNAAPAATACQSSMEIVSCPRQNEAFEHPPSRGHDLTSLVQGTPPNRIPAGRPSTRRRVPYQRPPPRLPTNHAAANQAATRASMASPAPRWLPEALARPQHALVVARRAPR